MRARNHLTKSLPTTFANWSRNHFAQSHSDATKTFPRLEELRKRVKEGEPDPLGRKNHVFELSKRGLDFVEEVSADLNKKYSRGGKNGEGFIGVDELIKIADHYYNDEEKKQLIESSDSIQNRMRVKVSKSYLDHMLKVPENAIEPNPALKIVMPDVLEIENLEGEIDPSNQNRYSPMAGLLHKYEMMLALVSINCSSHCRYCYRLDLFNGTSNKSKADMPVIAAYIKTFNSLIDDAIKHYGKRDKSGLWIHKETLEPLIHAREILFSGGDPMTLPNATLARYMALVAEAGISTIRIGTKELVFNPSRFDSRFWEMMDKFHETYPEVRVDIVGHYSHPYELVEARTDRSGKYLYDFELNYRTRKDIKSVLGEINNRTEWVGHFNQFPIIAGVNDSPEILRLIITQSYRLGIELHNIYACREIQGNKHFRADNTIEAQCELLQNAKIGLSGLKNHSRLVMSTEYGKMTISSIKDGNIILELNRFIHGKRPEIPFITVDQKKLPEGQKLYWLTEDVIESAVSENDKKILSELKAEDNSLIKHFKRLAAAKAFDGIPQNDNNLEISNTIDPKVTIEVRNRNGGSKMIYIDLSDEKYQKNPPTLATILAQEKEVEAACKEQLSCSTCVGEVELIDQISGSKTLPSPSEDEKDVVDSVIDNAIPSSKNVEVRAACQITLKPASHYKFSSLIQNSDIKR